MEGEDCPSIEVASHWLSLLLDKNYHQLVMTSEVEIHRMLLRVFSDVNSLVSSLKCLLEWSIPLVRSLKFTCVFWNGLFLW